VEAAVGRALAKETPLLRPSSAATVSGAGRVRCLRSNLGPGLKRSASSVATLLHLAELAAATAMRSAAEISPASPAAVAFVTAAAAAAAGAARPVAEIGPGRPASRLVFDQ
jgi:hypothetical protein